MLRHNIVAMGIYFTFMEGIVILANGGGFGGHCSFLLARGV